MQLGGVQIPEHPRANPRASPSKSPSIPEQIPEPPRASPSIPELPRAAPEAQNFANPEPPRAFAKNSRAKRELKIFEPRPRGIGAIFNRGDFSGVQTPHTASDWVWRLVLNWGMAIEGLQMAAMLWFWAVLLRENAPGWRGPA